MKYTMNQYYNKNSRNKYWNWN